MIDVLHLLKIFILIIKARNAVDESLNKTRILHAVFLQTHLPVTFIWSFIICPVLLFLSQPSNAKNLHLYETVTVEIWVVEWIAAIEVIDSGHYYVDFDQCQRITKQLFSINE